MFWHFLKVVYSRACESRGVWIKVRKLKSSKSLHIVKKIIIMMVWGIIMKYTERVGNLCLYHLKLRVSRLSV